MVATQRMYTFTFTLPMFPIGSAVAAKQIS
jgi:hypothetical protein